MNIAVIRDPQPLGNNRRRGLLPLAPVGVHDTLQKRHAAKTAPRQPGDAVNQAAAFQQPQRHPDGRRVLRRVRLHVYESSDQCKEFRSRAQGLENQTRKTIMLSTTPIHYFTLPREMMQSGTRQNEILETTFRQQSAFYGSRHIQEV
jgi:hypothetical protein